MQTELANANSVAEEALSSMATVKAHAAEPSTRHAYQQRLRAFAALQACVLIGGCACLFALTVRTNRLYSC